MNKAGKLAAMVVVVLAAVLMTAHLSVHAAVSVSLVPVSGAPGTMVRVSGSADPDTWVAVKVLDETGSIVFFDTVESDGTGAYSCIFTAPVLPPGPLTVIAGYDTTVAQAVFTLLPGGGGPGGHADSDPSSALPRSTSSPNLFLIIGLASIITGGLIILGKNRDRESGLC